MKTLSLVLAVLLCTASFAQVKFEPGYFITNDGKNVPCFIKDIGWDNSPKEFYYSESQGSSPIKAGINEVKEFGVDKSFKYQRFLTNIDTSKNDLQNLDGNKNPEYKQQLVFLKVLVEGKGTLYSYKSEGMSWFFYGAGDSVEPLVYKRYQSSETNFGENALYKSQLIENFSCQELSPRDIESLQYNAKTLSQYFIDYNNCVKAPAVIYSRPSSQGGMFHLNVRPGVSFSSLDMEYTLPQTSTTSFGNKTTFRLGLEAELVLPFNKNKWALIIEPTYEYYKSDETSATSEAFADYKAINIPLGLRYYMFLSEKSKLFLNAGFAYSIPLSTTLIAKNGFSAQGGAGGSFFAGAGFTAGRLTVEGRYSMPKNIMDQYNAWRAELQSISLVVGFRLL